jgi:hypothetical protein
MTTTPVTPPQQAAQSGFDDGDSEGASSGTSRGAEAGMPAVPASMSSWGNVPMRPVQRSLLELLAQVRSSSLPLCSGAVASVCDLY